MIFNFKREDQAYSQSICSLTNLKLDNVKSFKYLGCQIQYNQASLGSMELNSRINCAKAAFQSHKTLRRNFRISLKTRLILLNSFVCNRLIYGFQS